MLCVFVCVWVSQSSRQMEALNASLGKRRLKLQMNKWKQIVQFFPYQKGIVLKRANHIKLEMLIEKTFNFSDVLNHTHVYCLIDFALLFWFPLMFTESLCLRSIKVSLYIPLPFIPHIFPTETECHIDLISFDCSGSSWGFYGNFKNSRIDQSDNWSQKKHRNNQSEGVMVDECWSTVDCPHVISMAPIDLLANSWLDRSIEKRGRR